VFGLANRISRPSNTLGGRLWTLRLRKQSGEQYVERIDREPQRHGALGSIGSEKTCTDHIAEHAPRTALGKPRDASDLAALELAADQRLTALDAATKPSDLAAPGWRLHPLSGDLKGFHSITVDANWRVIFRFVDKDVELIDYLDYH
jgi:proteic killer suppression protein